MVSAYYGGASPGTVTLTGLAAGQAYNLYVYTGSDTNAGAAGRTGTFTVGSTTQNYTWDGSSSTLINGVDYLKFSGVTSAGGTLTIVFGNTTAETDLNGFQLQLIVAVVPVQLTIAPSGNNVIVTWPTNGTSGFNLQSRTNLVVGSWTAVGGSPAIVGSNYQVTVPASGVAQFFRLLK
jgi:hypothetical protein